MKKNFLFLAMIMLLGNGSTAEAQPVREIAQPSQMGHPEANYYKAPPRFRYNISHKHGCPFYRGQRCTCHNGGSGIYIDFRLPIVF